MAYIPYEQLSLIPYIDSTELRGRFLATTTFYVDNNWRMWIDASEKIIELKIIGPSEATYFGDKAEKETDPSFHFLNFLTQRANRKEILLPFSGIVDDIFNLSASLAKVDHLNNSKEQLGKGLHRLVSTEIEYLLFLCRSIFDLLQEIIQRLWSTVKLIDKNIKKRELKDTFSRMVLVDNKPASREAIQERFNLPLPLADYYHRQSAFFCLMRQTRDKIAHGGEPIQAVFPGDEDFLIQKNVSPLGDLGIWFDSESRPNDLVPLKPLLHNIVLKTIAACNDFSNTIEKIIAFPNPSIPGLNFFMRGYFDKYLYNALIDGKSRSHKD